MMQAICIGIADRSVRIRRALVYVVRAGFPRGGCIRRLIQVSDAETYGRQY